LRLVSYAYMPSPLPRQVRWSLSARPSPSSTVVSGPAQRSLTLWPVRSPSRLATLYIESSDSFVASAAVSIATGWSEPVPGRELHPLKSSAFHGALFHQLCVPQARIPRTQVPCLNDWQSEILAGSRAPREMKYISAGHGSPSGKGLRTGVVNAPSYPAYPGPS
jgi:hypothetical protein